jgi:predicted ATPase
MAHSPVFVVGSPRSGTSILVRSLHRAGYSGYNEGHVLSLIRVIERDVDRHFATFFTPVDRVLISRVDLAGLKARLTDIVAEEAARHQGNHPWVDKTGGADMIESIPTLRRIFPHARYVFAKRRAIENIVSRMVKFPGHGFEYHCAGWTKIMAAWRTLLRDHPDLAGIEIDQRDISASPAEVAGRLGAFLDLAPAAIDQLTQNFTTQKPQQTMAGSADRVLSLNDLPWTDAQRAIFHKNCDGEMAAFGYVSDASYRMPDPPRA